MRYISNIKKHIKQFIASGTATNEIAFGIALGTFIGFIPMIGVHSIMAFVIAYILRLNPLILFLGTQISNPVSFPFLLLISAESGNLILHGRLIEIKFSGNINYFDQYLLPLIVGSLVLGTSVSVLSYFLIKVLLRRRRDTS